MLVGRPLLLQRPPLGPAERTQRGGAEGGGGGAKKRPLPPHPACLVWTAQVKKKKKTGSILFFFLVEMVHSTLLVLSQDHGTGSQNYQFVNHVNEISQNDEAVNEKLCILNQN